ncbi:MAG: DciA family protein [Steroidobacteraceae bacterium]
MRKPKDIKELMAGGSDRLTALKSRTRARSDILTHVCSALPPKLAETVASAGLEHGQLTIGVVGAAWASRLRYGTETLRTRVGESLGVEIQSIRIKVVPPVAKPSGV